MKRDRYSLEDLLRDVSRSFYLTLRFLPKEIRLPVSLAYLLARATDTIADSFSVARTERLYVLNKLQEAFLTGRTLTGRRVETTSGPKPFGSPLDDFKLEALTAICDAQVSDAERRLLQNFDVCLCLLGELSDEDQARIRALLATIVTGQIFDIERFASEAKGDVTALTKDAELDHYTYMVAGCVGEFWTKMCIGHLEQVHNWDNERMCQFGIRFGKGLQLINVLRDIAWDLRRGRCYLPVVEPGSLLESAAFSTLKPVYERWLNTCLDHLDAGWQYTMAIPASLWRLRLACIWPIWIGLKTIARLRTGNPLDPAQRIKISRGEVYGVMARSFLMVRNDAALNRAFQKLRVAASRH